MNARTKSVGQTAVAIGDNLDATVEGNILTIKIDLTERLGTSGSGKSINVATTSGNRSVGSTGVTIGLNAYVKNPDYKKGT